MMKSNAITLIADKAKIDKEKIEQTKFMRIHSEGTLSELRFKTGCRRSYICFTPQTRSEHLTSSTLCIHRKTYQKFTHAKKNFFQMKTTNG